MSMTLSISRSTADQSVLGWAAPKSWARSA
jgi:hypothetical protein